MQLWFERYILPICAAVVFGITVLNPFKLDWQQRFSLFLAISAVAYFFAHTLHKPKVSLPVDPDQRISFLERQIESLQSQQKQLVEEKQRRQAIRGQLAKFLKEGKEIQKDIYLDNITEEIREQINTQGWQHSVEGYLKKSLDESYAERFRNPTHQLAYPEGIVDTRLAPLWADIGAKMAMLNDFISELRD